MLEISDLRVVVEGSEILKGVSLRVKSGEVHAVMGPNGSGKSTLAYTLAGHPAYIVGNSKKQETSNKHISKISLDGEDLLEMSPDERAKNGLFLAFQYPVEVPGVRVSKFLWEAYKVRFALRQTRGKKGQDEKKFDSVLVFNKHLEGLAEKLAVSKELLKRGLNEGFSGGEKKRLEVLQMALLEPAFAVLDETDSGLDIDAIKAVAKGVRQVVKDYNTGVMVITHYQRILKYLKPDRVHVMVGGKIVESGGGDVARKLEKSGYKLYGGGDGR